MSIQKAVLLTPWLPFWLICRFYIRQYVQSAVFPSVQSADIAVTSGPVWLQVSLIQLFRLPPAIWFRREVCRSFVSETQCRKKKIFLFSICAFQFISWAYPGICSIGQPFIILIACLSGQPVSRQGLIAGGTGQSSGQTGMQSDGWTETYPCEWAINGMTEQT